MLGKFKIIMMIVFSYCKPHERAIDEMMKQFREKFSDVDLKNSKVYPKTIIKYLKQTNIPGVKKENNLIVLPKKL